ncbi:CRISPR-associated helicase Cas3' [Streptomyces sp. NPDC054796]
MNHDPLTRLRAKSPQRGRPAELLTAHLGDTLTASRALERRLGRVEIAEQVLKGLFWPAAHLAGLNHDAGKIPEGFQDMVHGRRKSWGQRHEVVSLGFLPPLIEDPGLRAWVAAGIATHHRALTSTGIHDLETLYDGLEPDDFAAEFGAIPADTVTTLTGWLHHTARAAGLPVVRTPHPIAPARLLEDAQTELDQLQQRWTLEVDADTGLAAVLLQGVVTLADHLSSAHGTLSFHQPLDHTFPALLHKDFTAKGKRLRPHQHEAALTDGHLLLRAPTGSGKTEAALLWAARQVAALTAGGHGTPRVFFTLPYLASINAMATRLERDLHAPGSIGIAHSRAASYHLARAIAPEDGDPEEDTDHTPCRADAAAKALSRAAATRLFHESVRVATPYQLLRGALAGPAHSGILADAANSVFVLDELHAYDPQRLGYLLASARLWKRLGGRIAVLSATLPTALRDLFTASLEEEVTRIDAPAGPPRHVLRTRPHHLTDPAALAEIRTRLAGDESVLVVANNVAHARELFTALAPEVEARHGADAALLLHSRFTRGDRSAIEKAIDTRFGARPERRPGLLVATQTVEVSLDIDLDVLFTAAAPLEALLQRFGRVNRAGHRPPADVIVHQPAWTTRRREPGDFADGIYPRTPVEAGWNLLLAHTGQPVNDDDANTWLDQIYDNDWGTQWRQEVLDHRSRFESAFLAFARPFEDRSTLADSFDAMFNGTEAVLATDLGDYEKALAEAPDASGRLLADDLLLPLPHWAGHLTDYDPRLKVRVINGEYNSRDGLTAIHGPNADSYRPGEVL